ncbi:uncharacterized protein LOC144178871 [Haemaphysalis longicornis]
MPAPTYAYVRYHDGAKALVPVGLIKKFSPEGLEDLAKDRKVYWRSLAPADGSREDREEGYYDGDVLMLGATRPDLILRMTKKKIAVPDVIFDPPAQEVSAPPKQKEKPRKANQEKKKRVLAARAHKQRCILKKRKRPESSDNTDDDELVERRALNTAQKRIRLLEDQLLEERGCNRRLQELVYTKIERLLDLADTPRPDLWQRYPNDGRLDHWVQASSDIEETAAGPSGSGGCAQSPAQRPPEMHAAAGTSASGSAQVKWHAILDTGVGCTSQRATVAAWTGGKKQLCIVCLCIV